VLGALAALLLIGTMVVAPAQAAPDPCPAITDELNVSDPFLGSALAYDPKKKTITFTTEDGVELVGLNARKIGKRRVIITSKAPDLTIDVRADLLRGQIFASAVERDVDPDKPKLQGMPRVRHSLFIPQGQPMAKCRAAGPVKPPPTFAPTPTPKAKTCADFKSQADAQRAYRASPVALRGLDADKDGIACENNAAPRDETPVKA
jgi:hypothetical protein